MLKFIFLTFSYICFRDYEEVFYENRQNTAF